MAERAPLRDPSAKAAGRAHPSNLQRRTFLMRSPPLAPSSSGQSATQGQEFTVTLMTAGLSVRESLHRVVPSLLLPPRIRRRRRCH